MRGIKSNAGTAAVESTLALVVASMIFISGLALSYCTFARVWLDRAAYEASICLATDAVVSECERSLRVSVRQSLPLGEIQELRLQRRPELVSVSFVWFVKKNEVFKVRDDRRLPLVRSRARG